MHSLVLVVGDDVHAALAPFAAYHKRDPYPVPVTDEDIAAIATHFNIPSDDRDGLRDKIEAWFGAPGEIRDGRLVYFSTENPDARFDWYKVGGVFSGYLELIEPRRRRGLARLFRRGPIRYADTALKHEVHAQPILDDPPSDIVVDGEWHGVDGFDEEHQARWRPRFAELFARIGDDARITMVDLHS